MARARVVDDQRAHQHSGEPGRPNGVQQQAGLPLTWVNPPADSGKSFTGGIPALDAILGTLSLALHFLSLALAATLQVADDPAAKRCASLRVNGDADGLDICTRARGSRVIDNTSVLVCGCRILLRLGMRLVKPVLRVQWSMKYGELTPQECSGPRRLI
jgi:hypothetical protein